MSNKTIIFIYNADGTIVAKMKDFFHKLISPSTYPCNLCNLTYGSATMKKEWKDYIKSLPLEVRFLHVDEFVKEFPNKKIDYPSAMLDVNGELETFIDVKEMNSYRTLDDLISSVDKKIKII